MAIFFRIDNSGHPFIAFGTEAKLAPFNLPVYEVAGTEQDSELRAKRVLFPHYLKFRPYIDYSRQMGADPRGSGSRIRTYSGATRGEFLLSTLPEHLESDVALSGVLSHRTYLPRSAALPVRKASIDIGPRLFWGRRHVRPIPSTLDPFDNDTDRKPLSFCRGSATMSL